MTDKTTKTMDELTGTNSGTYEEAVESNVLRRADLSVDVGRVPDMPTGAAVHVNPALNPAPIWNPVERPAPVPVINDPGLLGNRPSLADLNAAARASYGIPAADATSGITNESQQQAIKDAAEDRQKRMLDNARSEAKAAVADAKPAAKSGDKFGRASKA